MLLVILVIAVAVAGVLVVGRMVRRNQVQVAAPAGATAVAMTKQTIAYGSSADQTYDVWPAQGGSGPAPLVMFVHGWRLDERQQGLGERSVHVGLLPVRGVRVRVAAAPNAPAFLLPHVQRPGGIAQANELAAALQAAGTSAEEASFPGTGLAGHAEINRRLGDLSYAETPVGDAWLAKVFA